MVYTRGGGGGGPNSRLAGVSVVVQSAAAAAAAAAAGQRDPFGSASSQPRPIVIGDEPGPSERQTTSAICR